jgi:hypothetical protein
MSFLLEDARPLGSVRESPFEARLRPGASEMEASVLKSPEARFLNFEAHFNPSFLDAPTWIELRGFEAGGELPATL